MNGFNTVIVVVVLMNEVFPFDSMLWETSFVLSI